MALETVRGYILEAVPDAEQLFNYDIPAFTLVKGGKREQQIMIAGYERHIGFYPHPATIEAYAQGVDHLYGPVEEGKLGSGEGCIRSVQANDRLVASTGN